MKGPESAAGAGCLQARGCAATNGAHFRQSATSARSRQRVAFEEPGEGDAGVSAAPLQARPFRSVADDGEIRAVTLLQQVGAGVEHQRDVLFLRNAPYVEKGELAVQGVASPELRVPSAGMELRRIDAARHQAELVRLEAKTAETVAYGETGDEHGLHGTIEPTLVIRVGWTSLASPVRCCT